MRPRDRYCRLRSFIEVPILNPKYWSKVPEVPADAIMMDLEDSAPAASKEEARRRVGEALGASAYFGGRQIVVRVNNLQTPWGRQDLDMLAGADADVIVCYPKAESAAELSEVINSVRCVRSDRGVWAMVETPLGLTRLDEIARTDGLVGLHFGYTDYVAELGVSAFDSQGASLGSAATHASHVVSIAAAANGLFATGGSLIPEFKDLSKVETFLRGWAAAGYTGCLALSPAHVPIVNRVFSPSGEEAAHAREACAAFEAAIAAGFANAKMDGGAIVTLPEYRRLRALLARVHDEGA